MAAAFIQPIPDLDDSHVHDTDSYKWSQPWQYPRGMTAMASYFSSRGGPFSTCTLFGAQYLNHRYLSKPVTREQVADAVNFSRLHGVPFDAEGWGHLVEKRGGRPQIRIRAIPEGLVVPTGLPLFTVESTDPLVPWLSGHFETALVRLWEGSTIATTSREMAKTQKKYLQITAVDPGPQDHLFSVHDFGGRGVTCREQARIAGAAHLLSFRGSDTIEGIRMANHYYHCEMAGFSIPASEHSTVTMWGRAHEFDMVEDHIQRFLVQRQVPAGTPKIAACVADSYDVYNFTKQVTSGRLLAMIKGSGGKFVERPDSGNPLEVLPKVLDIARENLGSEITVNQKGFKVLPPYFGFIQGDGIDMQMHEKILQMLVREKWCVSSLAFGSGGGLLQRWGRDDQKWKLACSAGIVDGVERLVQKDPITDPGKRSRAGRLDLVRVGDDYRVVTLEPGQLAHRDSVMQTIYEDGEILVNHTLEECRARMAV